MIKSIANTRDIEALKNFDISASMKVETALSSGKHVEKIESGVSSKGDDYTRFFIEGVEVCNIIGYCIPDVPENQIDMKNLFDLVISKFKKEYNNGKTNIKRSTIS